MTSPSPTSPVSPRPDEGTDKRPCAVHLVDQDGVVESGMEEMAGLGATVGVAVDDQSTLVSQEQPLQEQSKPSQQQQLQPPQTPTSPASPTSPPTISFPALHLGSFHSLSLKDFSTTDDREVDGLNATADGAIGGTVLTTAGSSPSSPARTAPVGPRSSTGKVPTTGHSPISRLSDHDFTMPPTREVAIPRRLTVVQRPQGSVADYSPTSQVEPPTPTTARPRESETGETGVLPSSSGGTSVAGKQVGVVRVDSLSMSSASFAVGENAAQEVLADPSNAWPSFPKPPTRTEQDAQSLSITTDGVVPTMSPVEMTNSPDHRKKRRLPSTPVGVSPRATAVSGSPVEVVSRTTGGRSRSGPDPGVDGTAAADVQPSRSRSAPGVDAGRTSTSPISGLAPPGVFDDNKQVISPSMRSLGSAANWPEGVEIHRAQVAQVGMTPREEAPRPSRRAPHQVEVDQIARNSFEQPADLTSATPAADGGLSNMPAYLAMDMSGGPYPSYARPTIEVAQAQQQVPTVGPPGRQQARQTTTAPVKVKLPPPQEEVCLECLMRDRDLMHVDVTTDGAWERATDADWRDMLEREREWEWEVEQGQREGYLVADSDADLLRLVPWRGFSWEEAEGGTGLPPGFRGRDGGMLLEERLKELALRTVSPSSHRLKTLQSYLRDQALLIESMPQQVNRPRRLSQQSRASYPTSLGPQPPPADDRIERYQPQSDAASPISYTEGQSYLDHQDERRDRMVQARQRLASISSQSRAATMYDAAAYEPQVQQRVRHLDPRAEQSLRTARAQNGQLDVRKGRGISSPGLLETRQPDTYGRYAPSDPAWTPQPAGQGRLDEQITPPIRPFSFAVWAGRNGDASGAYSSRSSPGPRHGGARYDEADGRSVRSGTGSGFFGRWGGSVTSFFGGSQGGLSGSMIDMHLGLESDRRYTTSQMAHPRSASMASPPRPSFFSRDSRTSLCMYDGDPGGQDSVSQLGMYPTAEPAVQPFTEGKQKRGLKGFLAKLGGGGKKKQRPRTSSPAEDAPRALAYEDYAAPLAPPPPLSYLVNRQSKHKQSPSGGSSASRGPYGQPPPLYDQGSWPQQRSVSAPIMPSSSSGSLPSVSPTSSRFQSAARDSYVSQGPTKRRSSGPLAGVAEGRGDSSVEMLEQERVAAGGWTDDLPPLRGGYGRAPPSLTNSSGTLFPPSIESPGLSGLRPGYPARAADKQKMLPPLPPMEGDRSPSSPDSLSAYFADRYVYDDRAPDPRQHARQASAGQASYSSRSSAGGASATKSRSRFGLKSLFAGEPRRSTDELPPQFQQRQLQGDPRYRQTHYQ